LDQIEFLGSDKGGQQQLLRMVALKDDNSYIGITFVEPNVSER
jgi:hypothetical protein